MEEESLSSVDEDLQNAKKQRNKGKRTEENPQVSTEEEEEKVGKKRVGKRSTGDEPPAKRQKTQKKVFTDKELQRINTREVNKQNNGAVTANNYTFGDLKGLYKNAINMIKQKDSIIAERDERIKTLINCNNHLEATLKNISPIYLNDTSIS